MGRPFHFNGFMAVTARKHARIQITNTQVSTDASIGDSVGVLSVTHGSGSYTFSLLDNDSGKYSLTGATLKIADVVVAGIDSVQVRADNGVTHVDQFFSILVAAPPDVTPPTITSSSSPSVAENAVLAFALTANESVSWTIIGGADQAQFEISGSTLRWIGNKTQDFEDPLDSDANNTYVVQVRATDTSLNFTNQTVTVTVTNVSEGGASTAGQATGLLLTILKAT